MTATHVEKKGHLRKACRIRSAQEKERKASKKKGKSKYKGSVTKAKEAVRQLKREESAEKYFVLRKNGKLFCSTHKKVFPLMILTWRWRWTQVI